jgi:hypothetical protein
MLLASKSLNDHEYLKAGCFYSSQVRKDSKQTSHQHGSLSGGMNGGTVWGDSICVLVLGVWLHIREHHLNPRVVAVDGVSARGLVRQTLKVSKQNETLSVEFDAEPLHVLRGELKCSSLPNEEVATT